MATIAVVAALLSGGIAAASTTTTTTTLPASQRALYLELPGPFNGCTALDSNGNATMDAVYDLTRPSAFLTNQYGNLVGAGGPIASAELTSLTPETVKYSIAGNARWSDGVPFTADDLFAWWQRARTLASVASDGYRSIGSFTVAPGALSATVVFTKPYAAWNTLFRDVEARGSTSSCSLSALTQRPSLGPYRIVSATARRLILAASPSWSADSQRFKRIVVVPSDTLAPSTKVPFVNYTLNVGRSQVDSLSAHPTVLSHIGISSQLEALVFSPHGVLTKTVRGREALSWSLQRQRMIDLLWGSVTYLPSVAVSVLYSQGQNNYPGSNGSGPTEQSTTTTTVADGTKIPASQDCASCAVQALRSLHFVKTSSGWRQADGAPLNVRLGVGPNALDEHVGNYVAGFWRALGLRVTIVEEASAAACAHAAATGAVDAAIFQRPTTTTVAFSARSWTGPAYPDAYASGFRSTVMTADYQAAIATFNPVTANASWSALDQYVLANYFERPLFTAPSLLEWSNVLSGVNGSFALAGIVDQVPTLGLVTPGAQG